MVEKAHVWQLQTLQFLIQSRRTTLNIAEQLLLLMVYEECAFDEAW